MGKVLDNIQKILCCAEEHRNREHAYIEETASQSKIKKIMLYDLDNSFLVLKPDEKSKGCVSNLFKTEKEDKNLFHNRACDAIIIKEYDNSLVNIAYIELKSGRSRTVGQFKSMFCFMFYIQALLKWQFDIDMKIEKSSFHVFYVPEIEMAKRTSRPKKSGIENQHGIEKPQCHPVSNPITDISVKHLLK